MALSLLPPPPPPPPPWTFAPSSKCVPEDQYTDLKVIDLSLFHLFDDDGSEASKLSSVEADAVQKDLVAQTLKAFNTTGFIALKGHGLTSEDIQHQFALGKLLMEDVGEEEKHRLLANIKEGSWAGYKPQGYHQRPDGSYDCVEHYDFYPYTARESNLPELAKPYTKDFRGFIEHQHYVVLRKLLGVLSLGLGLDKDYLWNLHHRGSANDGALKVGPDEEIDWTHSKDISRYVRYRPLRSERFPPAVKDRAEKDLWEFVHTDFGSLTFRYSQPIAAFQVLVPNGKWRYIRHYPEHIIVSLGDSMEFLTGGVLKAAPHRVVEPPKDQRHLDILGIVYFTRLLSEVKLSLINHSSLKELGAKDVWEEYHKLGGKTLTSNDWITRRSKLVGAKRIKRLEGDPEGVLDDIHFRHHPERVPVAGSSSSRMGPCCRFLLVVVVVVVVLLCRGLMNGTWKFAC
ncbi:Clavaminate synthase-like protein [Dendrothele bispora CBS 962.96]|uniref:Clavaminate synthase-like protein n=1 Tax=Dendrothele bispora (strain CBS 962.96) TaxID=1314807 RepID=A0A4S8MH29_DENBC|nr:Clavaminate synthase-like protein [Dendrothele bispora CBS 962.96]